MIWEKENNKFSKIQNYSPDQSNLYDRHSAFFFFRVPHREMIKWKNFGITCRGEERIIRCYTTLSFKLILLLQNR